jgi:hypothetical protein
LEGGNNFEYGSSNPAGLCYKRPKLHGELGILDASAFGANKCIA